MIPEFNLRPFAPSDAQVVVHLINAAAQPLNTQRAVVDGAGNVRLARYVPPVSQKVVVTNRQNEVVGYAYLADRDQHIVYEVGGAVHPDYWQRGVGTMLLGWAEQQAGSLSNQAPAGIRTVLQTNLYEAEHEAVQLFTESGYANVRGWLHLVIELEAPPAPPTLPGRLTLRQMDLENDWEIVGPAMDEAFADHWGTISLTTPESLSLEEEASMPDALEDETYSNTPGFCFLVMDRDLVAGGILCNARLIERSHTDQDTGRVGSLFVRPGYRRQGTGRTLMLAAFQAFWQNGIRRIITDTDAESFTDAPSFYNNLGMKWYRREFLYEKEIRPGKEVRRLSDTPP
jgi:GNAT superfamily N-acetyltransferase